MVRLRGPILALIALAVSTVCVSRHRSPHPSCRPARSRRVHGSVRRAQSILRLRFAARRMTSVCCATARQQRWGVNSLERPAEPIGGWGVIPPNDQEQRSSRVQSELAFRCMTSGSCPPTVRDDDHARPLSRRQLNASNAPDRPLREAKDLLKFIEYVKASVRARVEHPFRVVKQQFHHTKVKYRGLMKNTSQLHVLFGLSNLWMARRKLMAMAA